MGNEEALKDDRHLALLPILRHQAHPSKDMTETPSAGSSVPALEKGMDVLEFLAQQTDARSLQEISTGLHRSRGELYRMVTWLVERQYILRLEGQDKYVLGERLAHLVSQRPASKDLVAATKPLMKQLRNRVLASCNLSIRADTSAVIIATTDSPDYYSVTAKIGAKLPLWESPVGACMFHNLSEFQQDALLQKIARDARKKFEKERQSFDQYGYVERFSEAGPSIFELAIPGPVDNQITSAITVVKVLRNKEEKEDVINVWLDISRSSAGDLYHL